MHDKVYVRVQESKKVRSEPRLQHLSEKPEGRLRLHFLHLVPS